MSARHSVIRRVDDTIEYGFWLVFDADGGMRFARGEPSVGRGERAMRCSVTLPQSLFRTPELRATIAVADSASKPLQIDVEAAGAALKTAIGADVDLRVHYPEEPA